MSSVEVPRDAVQGVIDWWRAANESPGGVSSLHAIQGMRDHVYALHEALQRSATDDGCPWCEDVENPGTCPLHSGRA